MSCAAQTSIISWVRPIANAFGGGGESGRVVITTQPTPPESIALAVGSALAFTPILAVVSGVLAGLFLRPSAGAKATTAAVGVVADAGTLLALFVGASLLLGGRGVSGVENLTPVLSAAGAVAVGAGTAALTDLFLPTRPNG